MTTQVLTSQATAGRVLAFNVLGYINIKQPPYNAKGDGVTDDYAAIQAAIDYLEGQGAGIIFFPAGNPYLVSQKLVNSSASVTFLGAGVNNTSLMVRNDVTVLEIDAHWSQICNLYVIGKGANNDTGSFGASVPAVIMNGVSSRMSHVRVDGGTGVRTTSDDVYLEDVSIAGSYGEQILLVDAVTFVTRGKLDHQWPVSQPASGTDFAAWAATTAYIIGDVVSVTSGGHTWYIQCKTAGTSGGSAPTLKNYGIDIPDGAGTLVWLLVSRSDTDGIKVNANEFHATTVDLSGATRYGVGINGADLTFLHQFIIGQTFKGSILADTGSGLFVDQCELGAGLNTGTSAATIASGWTGDTAITDSSIIGTLGTSSNGVDIAGGVDARIKGNYFTNCDNGVIVRANVSQFIIAENSIVSCTASISVQAGTSNHYNIVNNLVNTSGAISDNGTGVNKTLSGNN
jgi:uncharacterized alkaline shock family protein YloU